ncbi:putative uncharacterized protein [Acidiphilium sp. CAG:727]|nr:putative uncharacterized protein [Acidiphilium sp. CAG:727]
MIKKYTVGGMTCSACSARVERCVKKIDGVKSVTVNLLTGAMSVTSDIDLTEEIRRSITAEGYTVKEGAEHKRASDREKKLKIRLIISLPLVVLLMYVAMGAMIKIPVPWFLNAMDMKGAISGSLVQAAIAAVIIGVNFDYYIRGFRNLFTLKPNMDSLVALGSSVSFIYGAFSVAMIIKGHVVADHKLMMKYMDNLYFEGAAMIVALITLGKYLEEKSKNKTMTAIGKLLELAPDTAIIEVNGEEKQISSQELKRGDIVILKDGANAPCDGVVIWGNGYADESAITGESIPVYKEAGEKIVCGTTFSGGYCKFVAKNVGEDSTVYKIVKLVEDANSTKVPIAKVADTVAGFFVPVVMGIALIAFAAWLIAGYGMSFAVNIGVSVLVVSCPCALGLATPVALMVGTGKAAENGILVKSGEALQKLASVDTVLLDKTGTLTANKPKITKTVVFSGDENELIAVAASAEKQSSHPLAKPIIALAEERKLALENVENYKAVQGQGLTATLGGEEVAVGNLRLIKSVLSLDEETLRTAEKAAEENPTVLFVACGGKLKGYFVVEDTVTEQAKKAVNEFKAMKMKVVMLTGDNERAASPVAKELGIDDYESGLLPQDKLAEVDKLISRKDKNDVIAFVGDGINDAPVLMRADVGISMGQVGSDSAIEASDVVLMHDRLSDIVTAKKIAKKTMRIVRENIIFSLGVKAIALILGAIGIPNMMWIAVFADVGVAMIAILNAMRALRIK